MDAFELLQALSGQPLYYALKSPDMDLYDFGFGKMVKLLTSNGETQEICEHVLHLTCNFKVIWRNGEHRVDKYTGDTPCEVFYAETKRLIGLNVRRVALSEKNDLWLDLGDYWIVFVTFENGEESWRYFTADTKMPHVVASDDRIDLVD